MDATPTPDKWEASVICLGRGLKSQPCDGCDGLTFGGDFS